MDKCCVNCEYYGIEQEKSYCSRFDVYLEKNMLEQIDSCDDYEEKCVE